MTNLPSLFDEEEPSPPPKQVREDLPVSAWQEVPASRFNSWTSAQQLAYCRARDEDAALYTESFEDALWHQGRAQMYADMLREESS